MKSRFPDFFNSLSDSIHSRFESVESEVVRDAVLPPSGCKVVLPKRNIFLPLYKMFTTKVIWNKVLHQEKTYKVDQQGNKKTSQLTNLVLKGCIILGFWLLSSSYIVSHLTADISMYILAKSEMQCDDKLISSQLIFLSQTLTVF